MTASISTMVKYWDRLEPEMTAREMDITALSKALKVSFQAVAKVRDGGSFGSKNNLKAAAIFGLNPNWLATGNGQKHAETTARHTASLPQVSASGEQSLSRALSGIQKSLDGSDGSTQKIALILIGDMLAGIRTAENVASAIDAMLKTAAPLEMPTETNQIVTKALAK
jgi:hypothetical protein